MAKYIDADRLLAEIDRRILQEQGFEDGDTEHGYKCALKDVKRFITSLQQEQPEVDLEEEINRYLEPIHTADIQFEPFTQMTKCARHFYELGYNARKEK